MSKIQVKVLHATAASKMGSGIYGSLTGFVHDEDSSPKLAQPLIVLAIFVVNGIREKWFDDGTYYLPHWAMPC